MDELKPTGQTNEVITFDFSELGEKADAAQELDNDFCDNADEAVAHAKKALRSFKRLHDLMANHYQGTWRRWLGFRNITKDDAARMLRKYDYVVANCDNADYILRLSDTRGGKGLVDEAARPSTPQALKDGVAQGEVTTLAEFRRLKEQLEMARAENKALRANPKAGAAASEELQAAQDAAARSDAAREAAVTAASEAQEKAENLSMLLAAEQKSRQEAERSSERLTQMAASLNATIQRQREELANRPNVETVVVPEDYDTLKRNCASLEKENAELKAHAQGMSVQQLAESDPAYAKHAMTDDEEAKAAREVSDALHYIDRLPFNDYEMQEYGRCYLDHTIGKEKTIQHVQQVIERARRKIELLAGVFSYGPKLKVVK